MTIHSQKIQHQIRINRSFERKKQLFCSFLSNSSTIALVCSSSREAHLLSFLRASPFDLSEPPSVAEGPARVKDHSFISIALSSTLLYLPLYFHYPAAATTGAWSKPGRRGGGYTTRRQPKPIPIASTHRRQQRRVSRIMCSRGHDCMTRQIIVRGARQIYSECRS